MRTLGMDLGEVMLRGNIWLFGAQPLYLVVDPQMTYLVRFTIMPDLVTLKQMDVGR